MGEFLSSAQFKQLLGSHKILETQRGKRILFSPALEELAGALSTKSVAAICEKACCAVLS
jgi:hypothetical protein